jgi:hypothetical protein
MSLKIKKLLITTLLIGIVGFMGINLITLPTLSDIAFCTSGTCQCTCGGTDCICESSQGGCFCECEVGNWKRCDPTTNQ